MKNEHWLNMMVILLLANILVFLAWHFLHSHRIKVLTEAVIRLESQQKP